MKYRVHEIARMTGLESEVIIDHLRDVGSSFGHPPAEWKTLSPLKVLEFFGAAAQTQGPSFTSS